MTLLQQMYPGDVIASFAIRVLIEVTLVSITAVLFSRLFGRQNPAFRHGVCVCALICVLLAPISTYALQSVGWRTFEISLDRAGQVHSSEGLEVDAVNVTTAVSSDPFWTVERPRSVASLTLLVWMFGSGILLLRLWSGTRKVNWLLNSAQEVHHTTLIEAVNRLAQAEQLPIVPVRFVRRLHSPVVVGILRPTVILPEQLLSQLDVDQLRCVLAHELTHVRQRDPLVGLIQRIVEASYWPHPFVHLLNRDLVRAREEVCDNVALHGTTAPHYANTLLKVALGIQSKAPAPGMIGLMTPPWKLEERVKGLLDPRRRLTTTMNTRHLALLAVALASGTALVAGTRVVAAPVPTIPQETVKIVGHFDAKTQSVKYKAKTYRPTDTNAKKTVKVYMFEKDGDTIKEISEGKKGKRYLLRQDGPDTQKLKGKKSIDAFTITSDDSDISNSVSKTIKIDAFVDVDVAKVVKPQPESRSGVFKAQPTKVTGVQYPTINSDNSLTVTTVTNRDGKVETVTQTTEKPKPILDLKKQGMAYTITQSGDNQIAIISDDGDSTVQKFSVNDTVGSDSSSKQNPTLRMFKPGEKVKVQYLSTDDSVFAINAPVLHVGKLDPTSKGKILYRLQKTGQEDKVKLIRDDAKLFVTSPSKSVERRWDTALMTSSPTTVYIKGGEIRIVGDKIRVVYVDPPAKPKAKATKQSEPQVKKGN